MTGRLCSLAIVWLLAACGSSSSDGGSNGTGSGGTGAVGSGGSGGTGAAGGSAGAATGGSAGGGAVGGSGGGTAGAGGSVGGSGGSAGSPGSGGTGGGFDAGTDPDRNKVPAGQVCERLATIQCAGEAYCCASPGRTEAECYKAQRDACANTAYLDAISSNPVAGYDAAHAEQAFTEFEKLASECNTTIAAYGGSVDGLRGIAAGTKAAGASCKPPNLLNTADAAAYLASCKNPATMACLPSLLAWTCTARANAGGKCFTDVNCVDGLYCDNPNLSIAGSTCKQRKNVGATCGLANECASLACKGGKCIAADVQAVYCLAG